MTKRWSPEHLALARCAVLVREELRRILPNLPPAEREVVGRLATMITIALKARGARGARRKAVV